MRQPDRQHHGPRAAERRPEQHEQQDPEQEVVLRREDVGDPHDDGVDLAAHRAGQHADERAEHHGRERCQHRDPSEIRTPWMTRTSRSRPTSSVPMGCAPDGLSRTRSRSTAVSSSGAMRFANSATTTMSARNPVAMRIDVGQRATASPARRRSPPPRRIVAPRGAHVAASRTRGSMTRYMMSASRLPSTTRTHANRVIADEQRDVLAERGLERQLPEPGPAEDRSRRGSCRR